MVEKFVVVVVEEMVGAAPLLEMLRRAGLAGLDEHFSAAAIAASGLAPEAYVAQALERNADAGGVLAVVLRASEAARFPFRKRPHWAGPPPRYVHLRSADVFEAAAGLYLEARGAPDAGAQLDLAAARHALAQALAQRSAMDLLVDAPGGLLQLDRAELHAKPREALARILGFAGLDATAVAAIEAPPPSAALASLAAELRALAAPGGPAPAGDGDPAARAALAMRVRNDEDIVFQNLVWHFASGLRRFLIVDQGSTDSTRAEIARFDRACGRLGAEVVVLDDPGPEDGSGRKGAQAARAAHERFGADWILLLGPDEFLNLEKTDLPGLLARAEAALELRLGVARSSPLFMAGLQLPLIDHLCSPLDRPSEANPTARLAFRWRKPRPGFKTGSVPVVRWSPDLRFDARNQGRTSGGAPIPAYDAAAEGVHLRRFQIRSFDHFVRLAEDQAAAPRTGPDPMADAAEWAGWREILGRGGEEALRPVFAARFEAPAAEMLHDPLPGVVVRRGGVFIDRSLEARRPTLHLPFKGRQLMAVGGAAYEADQVSLRAPPAPAPVRLRLNTSDVPTFLQVFTRQEYAIEFPEAPVYVMDLGANIGLAAAWFVGRFPGARIVCVEPDRDNYGMLVDNTRDYPDVLALHAAVWPEPGRLEVVRAKPDGTPLGAWGVQTRALAGPGAGGEADHVPALTIPEIMRRAGFPRIDLLKVDIEGAELELFSRGAEDWLPSVRYLVVETHDRFRPGTTAAVQGALAGQGFEQRRSGENLVFIRTAPSRAAGEPWSSLSAAG
jgi:FkbM family methyltransferase